MSKKRYWFYNALIFIVFILFYFYPGLTTGGWVSRFLGDFPAIIIILGVAVIQGVLAATLYKYKSRISLFLSHKEKYVSNKKFWVILLLITFSVFFFADCKRYINMEAGLFDFALEEQVVWNTSQGRPFEASVEVKNYLGDHFSLLIALPAVIYVVLPSPFTLIAIQILCVVLAALAIKKIADRELKNGWLSLAVFLIYVFYIGLTAPLLTDYRAIVLGMPYLAWGLYFIESKKNQNIGMILLAIGAFAKEDMALFVGMIGLYQVLVLKKKRGMILAVFGFAVALIGLFVVIPYFRGVTSDTLSRYAGIAGLFQLVPEKIIYILRLFFPLLFLPILGWKKIWVLLPTLGINLFSIYLGQISALNQYDIANGLIIFWAFISVVKLKLKNGNSLYYWFSLLFIVNLLLLSGHSLRRYLFVPVFRYDDYVSIQEFKQKISPTAIISATNTIGGQFGQTRYLQIYDKNVLSYSEKPDYIIIDKLKDYSDTVREMAYADLNSGNYFIKSETDSILILQAISYQ